MDSDTIADLKQFISAEMHQHTTQLEIRLEKKIHKVVNEVVGDAKNEILEAIGDTMTTRDEVVDEQLTDHEHRLTRLEQKAA